MKNILVVIDMQNDFIRGSLSAFDAESIIPGIVQEITKRKPNDVLFTKDTHHNDYLNTSEGKHLPVVHCVENTKGWELIDEVKNAVRNSIIIKKPTFGSLILIDELKKRIKSKDDVITLVGVCSDICVVSNAVLVKTYFRENPVVVLKDCVRGVTEEKNREALDVMKSLQVEIQ